MNTTKTDPELLAVGDRIWDNSHYGMRGPYPIDRVTATQAISGSYRFRRKV